MAETLTGIHFQGFLDVKMAETLTGIHFAAYLGFFENP
jgi:hypothetical protein